jgi:hypothetical protein
MLDSSDNASDPTVPAPRRRRFQFSLRTVLLSCVLVALLMGCLVLPLIQEAREAARRATCPDAVKRIGIAIHNYHTVDGGALPMDGPAPRPPAPEEEEQ